MKIHEFGGFSTSGMSSSIDSGKFSGWDDPRLPTLRAMRRRGFDPRSLAELWEEVGLTQKDISISLKTLESFNSRIIDSILLEIFSISLSDSIKSLILEEKLSIFDRGEK